MPIREGQSFGNYQVLARLGSGGMGVVYLAQHPLIGKKVALKVIHKDLAANGEVVARFFNEARAVNRIGSEHIVQINDFGQTPEGDHFFIMEYIEGWTLAQVLGHSGMLHPRRALHIAAQIAEALGAAHACTIIHRDLKPDNIMLTQRPGNPDFVKVLDFGLAKILAESGEANLTVQGMVLGTPQYMAPEVCESREAIDHRIDIYSLGVLLFQMITGRLPFDGGSMGSILVKQVTEPPPALRGINPHIPPSVEQIVLRCLAKSPDARFASMDALRDALLDPERYLAGGPPIMPSASPPASEAMQPVPLDLQPPTWPGVGIAAAPLNRTMTIETPAGYRAARPRRRGYRALAVLMIAAVAGAVVMSLMMLTSSDNRRGETSGGNLQANTTLTLEDEPGESAGQPAAGDRSVSTAGSAKPAPSAAPPEPLPTIPAAVAETVTIRLVTRPAGARVFDLEDKLLGETPVEITLPRDEQMHVLVFRHPDTRERRKSVLATGDASLELELERRDSRAKRQGRRRSERRHEAEPHNREIEQLGRDLDIMAPDF